MGLAVGATFGSYRIVEQAGRGGMATVYKAYEAPLARYVAIKVLPEHTSDDAEFRERFQQEAVAIARLRHPSILVVYHYGEEEGVAYIVTEWVDGGTFKDQLGAPLPVEYVGRLLAPIASALDYAHSRGVLHRDVKPSNILLQRDGTPVLADFGLARMMGSSPRLTRTGTMMGTPEYMAPEQAMAEPVGPATDQYSLAVVAYEALTGSVPFEADTPLAVLLAQVHKPLPLPRILNPSLSEELEGVLLKGLAKEAGHRYSTASQFIAALTEAARGSSTAPVFNPSPRDSGPAVLASSGGDVSRGTGGPVPVITAASSYPDETAGVGAGAPIVNGGPGQEPNGGGVAGIASGEANSARAYVSDGASLARPSQGLAPPPPSKPPWVLIGMLSAVAMFVLGGGLVVLGMLRPGQAACTNQLSNSCPLQIAVPATATLYGTNKEHWWYVDLPPGQDFTIELSRLPVDYDLDVRGPNGFHETSNEGSRQDENIPIIRSPGGRYDISVNAFDETSSSPYTLTVKRGVSAVVLTSPIPVPTSSFGNESNPFLFPPPGTSVVSTSVPPFLRLATPTPGTLGTDLSDFFSSMGFGCAEPGATGDSLTLGRSIQKRLTNDVTRHIWNLTVPQAGGTLRIELSDLDVDYDLHVRLPDSTCKSSVNSGNENDVVEIAPAQSGVYQITVVSLGDVSARPYTLNASMRTR